MNYEKIIKFRVHCELYEDNRIKEKKNVFCKKDQQKKSVHKKELEAQFRFKFRLIELINVTLNKMKTRIICFLLSYFITDMSKILLQIRFLIQQSKLLTG